MSRRPGLRSRVPAVEEPSPSKHARRECEDGALAPTLASPALPAETATRARTATATPPPLSWSEVDKHHTVLLSAPLSEALRDAVGGVLVNLDSHDDLGVPPASLKLNVREPASVQAGCDVGTWIVPLVSLGALRCVVWVTEHGNIADCDFGCLVHRVTATGQLCISGEEVPAEWRALWGDDFAAAPPLVCETSPLRVVVCHTKDAEPVLARVAVAEAQSPWFLTLDLDFFSTRNPARRDLPFDHDPPFASSIWRLARTVPISLGNEFYAGLLAVGEEQDRDKALAHFRAAAVGTGYEPRLSDESVRAVLEDALPRFAKLSVRGRGEAYGALLRAHLAEHQSVDEELAMLQVGFAGIVRVVMEQPHACREVLIARSDMYTTARLAKSIVRGAKRVLDLMNGHGA